MEAKQIIVGRGEEKEILSKCLEKVAHSEGQVVIISGEAGIGKSTLVNFIRSGADRFGMKLCVGESAAQSTSVPYHSFQAALGGISGEEIFRTEEFAYFDEVFLISRIGLLISHVSRSKGGGMDEDILGSMLTAVQDFVKDSFGGEQEAQRGGLGKLEYLNTKIFIEHGELVYLAAVTSGEEHGDMKQDIKRCLADIEEMYFDILSDWDGDIDSLSGTNDVLSALADKRFRVKRSLENINIQSERLKVQNRIHEIVESQSRDTGLLLVLEDVHWSDESTLLAIPFIARNIAPLKALLCITYRPDEMNAHTEASELIGRLSDNLECTRIELDRLKDEHVDLLASNLLDGEEPPQELLANLRSETQGNPFFIIEATRALITEGTLIKDQDIWVMKHCSKAAVPKTVTDLVSKRLESLDLDSLRLLEYGAILGRRFSIEMLSSGFGMGAAHIRELTEYLISLNILDSMGKGEVAFQHSKTQEVIYEGMSERWRRMSHRKAGQTYEILFKSRLEDALFNLAYHFSRTSEYDKGIDYCISAGQKASNNLAPREASQFFEKAVEMMEENGRVGEPYMDISQMLAELYELDGNYSKATATADNILDNSQDAQRLANAMLVKGRVMQSQGRYDDAILHYGKGISLAGDAGSTLLKAKINGYLGKAYLRKGEHGKAMEVQNAFLAESRKVGSERDIGQAYMNIGGVYWTMNDPQMAIRQWEASLDIFTREDFKQGIANLHDNLGVGYSTVGDMGRALEHYRKSEKIMATIGDVRGMSMVLLNMGALYNQLGQYEKSLDYNMKSLQIKKRIGDAVGAANIYGNIGANYYVMERYDEAIEFYRKHHEMMEKAGDMWGLALSLNNIAMAYIEVERFPEAKELCQRSLEVSLRHLFNDMRSYSSLFLGAIASHEGDFDSANENLEAGLTLAKETEDPMIIGNAHKLIARHCVKLKDLEKAMDNYAKAHEIFERTHMEADARKVRLEMQALMD